MTKKSKAPQTNTSKSIQRYVERLNNLEDEKDKVAEDIKSVKEEIKSDGLDPGTVADLVKIQRKHKKWQKKFGLLQLYAAAIQLPLFADASVDELEDPEREAA